MALLVAEAEPATVERLVLEDSPPPTGRGELRTAPAVPQPDYLFSTRATGPRVTRDSGSNLARTSLQKYA